MIDHLKTLRDQPAWQPMPAGVRSSFAAPLPTEGIGPDAALAEFFDRVLPYSNGNQHPRFWGFVQGSAVPVAALADFLASMMNAHLAGFDQAPALVEKEVIRWLAESIGLHQHAAGILASGGTMAGIMALALARHARAGWNVRAIGVQGSQPSLVLYASRETHHWLIKGVELLGLGRQAIHWIDVDDQDRIRMDLLRAAIAADRSNGRQPIAVIANAGTVQTGAIDPLLDLADLAEQENLWMHVDGAFGALSALSPKLAPLVAGIERADSVAFDLHKWMYLPFESACLLVRDPNAQLETFAVTAPYLAPGQRGMAAGGTFWADRGIELTRSFKALKVWITLLAYGTRRLGQAIEENVRQAHDLARAIDQHPLLVRMAPTPLNVVCFRFQPPNLVDPTMLDQLNEEILYRVQESGLAVPSGTRVRGAFALRTAIVNHRTVPEDLERLLEAVVDHGRFLTKERIGHDPAHKTSD
jgi:glutamate/tyrosine decarboxylase-like PLP-dependent enzyme